MSTLSFSRSLALCLGVITPLLETIRRWSTWWEDPPSFFDDFILGGLLIFGAWRVGNDARSGQKFLTAAWGFMCGMVYASFFGQLQDMRLGEIDPAPVSSATVAVIKGIGFALAILGLVTSLVKIPDERV